MKDQDKTKEQLMDELQALRRRIAELEASDRKYAQAQEKLTRLSAAVNTSIDGIIITDLHANVIDVNEAVLKKHGISRKEDMIGKGSLDFVAPEDHEKVLAGVAQVAEKGYVKGVEYHIITTDGRKIPVEANAVLMKDEDGQPIGFAVIVRDITDRRRAEQALRENEEAERSFAERLAALLEVTNALSQSRSVDDLCCRAVELGRSRLGFDRLSVWLVGDDPRVLTGTFGVDEKGQLRDERASRMTPPPDSATWRIGAHEMSSFHQADTPLYNDREEIVGRGSLAIAALWDGEEVIGCLNTDNFLLHEPITERKRELLALYASALGHLCTRIRAEEALRKSEQAERQFSGQLQTLNEIGNGLSKAASVDELCRMAVEVGRSRLGFDRLGVWLLDQNDPNFAVGTWGTDEKGELRDERASRLPTDINKMVKSIALEKNRLGFLPDTNVFNDKGEIVGRAANVAAPLWDGEEVIGYTSADNLLRRQPITERVCDLLALYASMLGHLCTRKRVEEALGESEKRYRALFEQAADSIALVDAETGALVEFSERAHENLGYTREEFRKLKIPDFEIIESAGEVKKHIEKVIGEGADTFETKHRTKAGDIRDVHVNCRAISFGGRQFVQTIWRDITDRKRSEEVTNTLARLGTRKRRTEAPRVVA